MQWSRVVEDGLFMVSFGLGFGWPQRTTTPATSKAKIPRVSKAAVEVLAGKDTYDLNLEMRDERILNQRRKIST